MKGYLNKPEATAEALKEGWPHTGDIGYVDADNDLYITDRMKEMIIRGGENIYPAEVEDALYRHTAVSEAAVFGLPDPKYGEEVYASVVLISGRTASEEDILTECRKHVPGYKCPKKITFREELPKTQTSKIQRKEVREMALKEMTPDES
jgi:acyl-CoA synthetase (AMP-forming)/AMP-acid ligase II